MEDHLKLLILSLAKYIEICLFPFNISFNYQINPANLFKYDFRFLFTSIITIFGFFIGPLVFVKNKKFVLCLQLFFLSFIITNLGIYLHDFNNISIAANRYAYLALFPTLFLLVFIINKILEFFPRFITPVTYFLLLVFVVFTCKETMLWKSPEKLFSVSMEHTGESMEILTAKGVLLLKNNMYPDAESIFTKLLNKYPNSIEALSNLCELYSKTEDRKKIRIFLKDHSIEIEKLPVSSYLMIANLYILIEKSEIARSFINKYISTYGSNDFSQMLYNQSKPE
jgi:tetratricopeptide (TPR) repeat protein